MAFGQRRSKGGLSYPQSEDVQPLTTEDFSKSLPFIHCALSGILRFDTLRIIRVLLISYFAHCPIYVNRPKQFAAIENDVKLFQLTALHRF